MSWIDRNLPWVLLTLLVVTAVATVGIVGGGVLALFAALVSGASVGALLTDAAVVLGATALLLAANVALAVALAVTVVRRASLPRSDRLAGFFAVVERLVPPMREVALSERFAPTVEDRQRELKRRYVEGELTELAFEREMRALLDESEPDAGLDGELGVDAGRREGTTVERPATGRERELGRE